MRSIFALIGHFISYLKKVNNFFIKQYQISLFDQIGSDIYIGRNCTFSKNISIGNDVSIGENCCFQSAHGKIRIGNHVMFGPDVHIHGGNHTFDRVGYLMKEHTDKKQGEDGYIIIEDDVWVGARAIILKGVRVGRGSIIGAGSVLTKDLPPYSVYTGIPTARLRQRWNTETVEQHEKRLRERGLL
jgi:acetyltransferase-like isoleucine patch superfamily enzyme